jgi:hypothetical protein
MLNAGSVESAASLVLSGLELRPHKPTSPATDDSVCCVVLDESPSEAPHLPSGASPKTDIQVILFHEDEAAVDGVSESDEDDEDASESSDPRGALPPESVLSLTKDSMAVDADAEDTAGLLADEDEHYEVDDDVMHMIDYHHLPNNSKIQHVHAKHHPHSRQPPSPSPLLNQTVASLVSSVSLATRMGLRIATLSVDLMFKSVKFTTGAGMGLARKSLVTAVSTARNLHLIALRKGGVTG